MFVLIVCLVQKLASNRRIRIDASVLSLPVVIFVR